MEVVEQLVVDVDNTDFDNDRDSMQATGLTEVLQLEWHHHHLRVNVPFE